MRIEYSEVGSVLIRLDSVEDRIIFNAIHGLASNKQLTFDKIDDSTLACRVKSESFLVGPIVYHTLTPAQNVEVIEYIRARQKLMAIKAVKEYANLGLKEAKDVVDVFCDLNPDI